MINEEIQIEKQLKVLGFQSFFGCVLLFHVKILETDRGDDYSDLEFRLLINTFEKFMMRDIKNRLVNDFITPT